MPKLLRSYFTELLVNQIIAELLDDIFVKRIIFCFKSNVYELAIIRGCLLIYKEFVRISVNCCCYSLFTIQIQVNGYLEATFVGFGYWYFDVIHPQ